MDHPLSFRILFDSSTNIIIDQSDSGYHINDCMNPYEKRHKPNSGIGNVIPRPPNYNVIYLQCGKVLHFFNEDGNNILTPEWVVWNPCVRKIIQRLPRSIKKRLRYLSYFMGEEEGHDEDENMIYEYLEDDVYSAYFIEMRLRRAMRNVLTRWRCYHMNRRTEYMDPITLSEPERPVVLYSWKAKRKYIFDAKSISLHIETQLLQQDSGFTTPLAPRNPWSNVEFTYTELVSLYLQIKRYGELRWGLCTLYESQFDKEKWFQVQQPILIAKALKQGITTIQSVHMREMIQEFILTMLEDIGILVTDYHTQLYRLGLIHMQDHWYIQKWKQLCIMYYESMRYHVITHDTILSHVRKLIKKQYYLIHELIQKGHLPRRPYCIL